MREREIERKKEREKEKEKEKKKRYIHSVKIGAAGVRTPDLLHVK